MVIDLSEMFKTQRILNEDILKTNNITFEEVHFKSHLALMCELMELANETRCFNYWSKKKRNEDDVVLEEYADVLCFTFSECIHYGIDKEPKIVINDNLLKQKENDSITKSFIKLIDLYTLIKDKETCLEFLTNFLILGYELGYNFDKIKLAFDKKCAKNHETQKENRGE